MMRIWGNNYFVLISDQLCCYTTRHRGGGGLNVCGGGGDWVERGCGRVSFAQLKSKCNVN